MPELSTDDSQDMRQRILDAAANQLASHGYKATTLRAIADAAGLKAASIYYHFRSKDQLTIEVLNKGVERVSNAVQAVSTEQQQERSGADMLQDAITAHLDALTEHSSYTRASIRCFSMIPDSIRQDTINARRELDTTWLGVLKNVQSLGAISKNTRLRDILLIILGTLNWTLEWQAASDKDRRELASSLGNLILQRPD